MPDTTVTSPRSNQPADAHAAVYRYDEFDKTFIFERVEQFRAQVERRLKGEITEEEFKPIRLMNGLYLQLHAYMLRVAVPYGMLDSTKLRRLARIARVYDKGYGHLTTRQNIQFNWPELKDIPAILHELAEVDMHAIQTSGNCIRNVTTDQFCGAAADELVDPRVYAEILRQWSTLHPEFTYLPRKFKIAISGAPNDRAAVQIHDVGLIAKKNEAGEIGFTVYVGGGLGRTPYLATKARDFVPVPEILGYLEAVLRTYNQLGRRDNIYKARIKITVNEMGPEKFIGLIEEEYARLPRQKYYLDPAIVAAIEQHFTSPPWESLPAVSEKFEAAKAADPAFARWTRSNLSAHRAPGYAIATISVKPIGGIPGDIEADQMEVVADLAERYSFGELRVSHEQNLVLAHVKQDDLYDLWLGLDKVGLGTANAGLISDIIACPGLDYCALANTRSIPIAQEISERFADLDRQHDLGELKIKISGCINACGHHHVGHIGILGVDKKGEEFFQILLGGDATNTAALAEIVGPGFSYDEIVNAVETVVTTFVGLRQPGERFIDTLARTGHAPFKEALYARA
ncbi:nitrite/sulfite reductase [Niveispirillum sp. BGYR6]|uniref:nitrite/sulfite reductase n=1 Tax=Niveispirillum sp. BGYR6 TaxID=2971249 RepID=UPI0022B993B7|nr:nitrite/sulfite reductase [Niveispirillum sp. BGYR6]MDG5496247.1 nitrite/sulfite reductase [Niveispirillum sp. BGYR6]